MVLETSRLRLREMVDGDLDFVAAMLSDPGVMRHYPKVLSRDEARDWIDRQRKRYAADGHGLWLVEARRESEPVSEPGSPQGGEPDRQFTGEPDRQFPGEPDGPPGEPIGQAGLVMQEIDGTREPEIGYLIHSRFWRRGYATEAALAVREAAFGRFAYDHAISLIRPENVPSQGVARRLGMTPVRETLFRGLPHLVFAIAREAPGPIA
jgi:RimJ/RimL family protein N-acetyltransferase